MRTEFRISPHKSACRKVFRVQQMVPGESRANRTLLSSVWAAAAVPGSVLTAARKLKYSWILRRFSGLISWGTR
jgi:hypothetical protein